MALLPEGNIYRYVIEVPAWRNLNVIDWAEYSRHADLGNGMFLFPIEAIGSAIPLIAASIIIASRKSVFKSMKWPVYTATIFALAGLALTFYAAPIMLAVHKIGHDPLLLQQAFEQFHFWGQWRAVAQIASFCACIWAMGKLFRFSTN